MKVQQLLENSEFDIHRYSPSELKKHLYKRQRARTLDIINYFHFLNDKYLLSKMDLNWADSWSEILQKNNAGGMDTVKRILIDYMKHYISPPELEKFRQKCNRLQKARIEFENVGGKIFDKLDENDEFARHEFTDPVELQKHLYKVQRARCSDLISYWQDILNKTNREFKLTSVNELAATPSTIWMGTLFGSAAAYYSAQELMDTNPKFARKYHNMFRAKQKYEDAGGDYITE